MTRALPPTTMSPARVDRDVRRGRRLGRYELLHPIAAGGMAEVWAAEQHGELGFRKTVALKLIRPEFECNQVFRAMFVDEALIAGRIKHGNVVETLDLGSDNGVLFHAMMLVEGSSLSAWVQFANRPLPMSIALRAVIDMLHGLEAAHELRSDGGERLGLLHRDVSPQNIVVGIDGVARLADFGIAKTYARCCVDDCAEACCSRRSSYETAVGRIRGKIGYLAPELLEGVPASRASDVYAAGVVLWETLTGQKLFDASGEDATRARKRQRVRDPREVAVNLPAPLASVVMQALSSDASLRFQTAKEMAGALEDVAAILDAVASHADVAALLEADMGDVIREKRAAIAAARRGTRAAAPTISDCYASEWRPATTQACSGERDSVRNLRPVRAVNA